MNVEQHKNEELANVIYGYYTTYHRLAYIGTRYKPLIQASNIVHIFIDVGDIVRKVESEILRRNIEINDPAVLAGTIVNMAAHYRAYFRTRFDKDSKIWFINTHANILANVIGKADNTYSTYQHPHLTSIYADRLMEISSLIGLICPMLRDIQYEDVNVDFVTHAKHINNFEKKNNQLASPVSIMVSKDANAVLGVDTNTLLLRPKKYRGQERSQLCGLYTTDEPVRYYMAQLTHNDYGPVPISYAQLPFFMALTRNPSRNLQTIYTVPKAVDMIVKTYGSGASAAYLWDYRDFENTFATANPDIGKPTLDVIWDRNSKCDVANVQVLAYIVVAESKLYQGIVNLYDKASLDNINTQYFSNCQLALDELC